MTAYLMRNAVILARVSTKEQEEYGHSLPAQTQKLREYAERKGFTVIKEFSFSESAGEKIRTKFLELLAFLKKQPEMPILLCSNVDRITRNFKDAVDLDEMRINDGLEIHFVQDGFAISGQSSGNDMFMWETKVFIAKQYLNRLKDDAVRSIKHKLDNGECVTKAPLGYLNTSDPKTGRSTVIVDQDRAFLVKKLFVEYATGAVSLHELTRRAKGWGLRSLKGRALNPQSVHNMLRNPFYYGMMRVREELYPHIYTTIIDKPLFDACKAVYSKPDVKSLTPSTSKQSFALSGLITCATTGKRVACDRKKGKFVYLISHDPQDTKKKLWTREEEIIEEISKAFHSITIPEAILEPMVDYLRESHESEIVYYQEQIKALRRETDDITKQMDKLIDMLLNERITQDIYDRKLSQLQNRRMEINAQMERHTDADGEFKIALSTLLSLSSRIGELFDRSKPEEKRRLVGFVFSNLQMDGKKLIYSMRKPFDLFVNLGVCKDWRPVRESNPCRLREREVS